MSCARGDAQERARSSRTKGDAIRAAASFSDGDNMTGGLNLGLWVSTGVVALEHDELEELDSEELDREWLEMEGPARRRIRLQRFSSHPVEGGEEDDGGSEGEGGVGGEDGRAELFDVEEIGEEDEGHGSAELPSFLSRPPASKAFAYSRVPSSNSIYSAYVSGSLLARALVATSLWMKRVAH